MYIYKVTHLPTRQFYIGISVESKDSFDPIRNPDPAGKFRIQGTNGLNKITNVENVIVMVCHSMDELISESTKLIKSYESNENFLSLQLHEDEKVILSDGVRELRAEVGRLYSPPITESLMDEINFNVLKQISDKIDSDIMNGVEGAVEKKESLNSNEMIIKTDVKRERVNLRSNTDKKRIDNDK